MDWASPKTINLEDREPQLPRAQFCKGVELDDKVYDPSKFSFTDWAVPFLYEEHGGEG